MNSSIQTFFFIYFIIYLFVLNLMILVVYRWFKKYKEKMFKTNNFKLIKGEKLDENIYY